MNFINLSIQNKIAHVELNRPEKSNALEGEMWAGIKTIFTKIDQNPDVRVVVLSGNGKHFCAGIDLGFLAELASSLTAQDDARKREILRRKILEFQDCFSAIEKCRKPVIAAIHSACVGGAVDLITACDLRYATADAYFTIKEIDIGMTADVGTLQRLPHLIGDGLMRELAYTGRKVLSDEAAKFGLVNRVWETKEILMQEVFKIAEQIAAKSPLAIRGIKEMILYTRDHSVADSLNYVATWNGSMLLSNDLTEAMMAQMERRTPIFED